MALTRLSVTAYWKGNCVLCLSHSVAVAFSIAVMVEGKLSHLTTPSDRRKKLPLTRIDPLVVRPLFRVIIGQSVSCTLA